MAQLISQILADTISRSELKNLELAELSGLSEPYVSAIRSGRRNPTADAIDKLLAACEVKSPGSWDYFCDHLALTKPTGEQTHLARTRQLRRILEEIQALQAAEIAIITSQASNYLAKVLKKDSSDRDNLIQSEEQNMRVELQKHELSKLLGIITALQSKRKMKLTEALSQLALSNGMYKEIEKAINGDTSILWHESSLRAIAAGCPRIRYWYQGLPVFENGTYENDLDGFMAAIHNGHQTSSASTQEIK